MEKYSMTEYDFDSFEKNLNIIFPNFYKNVLLDYPQKLKENEYGNQFLIYVGKDLLYNLVIRHRWFNPNEQLPRIFFPIGCDYAGNPFFINLKDGDEKIYIIDHDDAENFYDPETETVNWDIALNEFKPNILDFLHWLDTYLSD
jgi:SMI1-KNR4 cell-wall